MKYIYILFIIATLTLSCSKSDNEPENNIPTELIGKWKAIEIYSTDGGSPATWSLYDSGLVYDIWFKSHGTYMLGRDSSNNLECKEGNYSVIGNEITYSDSPCAPEVPVFIESLTAVELIIDGNFFEPSKTKYIRVTE